MVSEHDAEPNANAPTTKPKPKPTAALHPSPLLHTRRSPVMALYALCTTFKTGMDKSSVLC